MNREDRKMNINRRGDVFVTSSLFVLFSSAGGCARRSDGGGLDLPGGEADSRAYIYLQL